MFCLGWQAKPVEFQPETLEVRRTRLDLDRTGRWL